MKHIDIAISQIGVKEDPPGSNWGPEVKKYLASVGITFQASWCMAFVYWCTTQAYSKDCGLMRTGGVMKQWNTIPSEYKFKEPKAGDIFIMNFGKGLGHTGFVETIEGDTLHTIEGNATLVSGSREGTEVDRKTRKISACIGFIRL